MLVTTKPIPEGLRFHPELGVTKETDVIKYRARLTPGQIEFFGLANREIVLIPAADLGVKCIDTQHKGAVSTDTQYYTDGGFQAVFSKPKV